jgi:hypothetical protein
MVDISKLNVKPANSTAHKALDLVGKEYLTKPPFLTV